MDTQTSCFFTKQHTTFAFTCDGAQGPALLPRENVKAKTHGSCPSLFHPTYAFLLLPLRQ